MLALLLIKCVLEIGEKAWNDEKAVQQLRCETLLLSDLFSRKRNIRTPEVSKPEMPRKRLASTGLSLKDFSTDPKERFRRFER
jgi:hypothetical protein